MTSILTGATKRANQSARCVLATANLMTDGGRFAIFETVTTRLVDVGETETNVQRYSEAFRTLHESQKASSKTHCKRCLLMGVHNVHYHKQNLPDVWSHSAYARYEGAKWGWECLPFDNDFSIPNRSYLYSLTNPVAGKSILEIGSAMGQAYTFLKTSGLVSLEDYTGIEISNLGYSRSKERYPEANWIQADFTQYEITRNFDYAFERHAIHHMPEPVYQIRKVLKHVNLSMSTVFVGCLEGETVSDLEKGYYDNEGKGLVYFDIINVFDVVQAGLDEGFNHIRVAYYGLHEPIPTDPSGHQYLAPEVQDAKTIGRFCVRLTRCASLQSPLVYVIPTGRFAGLRKWVGEPWNLMKIRRHLNQMT